MEPINVVGFGGGSGLGVVGAGLLWLRNPAIRARLITAAFDDHPKSSTAALGNGYGYIGDVGRVLDLLHLARFGSHWLDWRPSRNIDQDAWLLKQSAIRYRSGIPEGKTFGGLYAEAFSPSFDRAVRSDPEQTLTSILKLLHVNGPEDEIIDLILKSFNYVFQPSDFKKHSLRNLRLYVLEKVAAQNGNSPDTALRAAHVLYGIPPEFYVEPITREFGTLMGKTRSGRTLAGQGQIDFLHRDPTFDPSDPIFKFWIEPAVFASRSVINAILNATGFVMAPGSLGGNRWALFSVGWVKDALGDVVRRSPYIPIILVTNLMTELGSTRFRGPWTAVDIFKATYAATGQWPTHVIHDTTRYSVRDLESHLPEAKIELGDWSRIPSWAPMPVIIQGEFSKKVPDDDFGTVEHSSVGKWKLVHDPEKLAPVLMDILSPVKARAFA